jgi:nicotinamidase-related amidase
MLTKNPISRSALLVIDAQDSFMCGERWKNRNNPAFEENVSRLIDGYRKGKLPVLFFLDSDDDEEFQPGSPYFKLMDFIEPKDDEPILVKRTRNCFTSTNLEELLHQRDVKRVIITGIKTEQCCETTARVASDMGYDVDYVTEATLTFPIPRTGNPGGQTLSADEVVARTEYVLRDRFAKIKTVDEILMELREGK